MCGVIGRAWANDRVGEVTPRAPVVRAAECHDDGWIEWERSPTLDRANGLPHTFATAPYTVHLEIHSRWSRALAAEDPYAGLLVSLHHASFFARPGAVGRLRRGGRRIDAFLDDLDSLGKELRRQLDVDDEEVDRNRRLVRTWDGISHDLLVNVLPRSRPAVPSRDADIELTVARRGDRYTVDPWPFRESALTLRAEGRLLRDRYPTAQALWFALAEAPLRELVYELEPA
jgi:hypothetical protein